MLPATVDVVGGVGIIASFLLVYDVVNIERIAEDVRGGRQRTADAPIIADLVLKPMPRVGQTDSRPGNQHFFACQFLVEPVPCSPISQLLRVSRQRRDPCFCPPIVPRPSNPPAVSSGTWCAPLVPLCLRPKLPNHGTVQDLRGLGGTTRGASEIGSTTQVVHT